MVPIGRDRRYDAPCDLYPCDLRGAQALVSRGALVQIEIEHLQSKCQVPGCQSQLPHVHSNRLPTPDLPDLPPGPPLARSGLPAV